MVGIDAVKGKFSKIVDTLMPPLDPPEDEVEATEEQTVKVKAQPEHKAETVTDIYKQANGESIRVEHPSSEDYEMPHTRMNDHRPHLTVHTTKAARLQVQIYTPINFDQVTMIADDLQDKKAVVVNYSKVEEADQRRICDFVNGVCYVSDGCAKRISNQIVLYVPSGVDVSEVEVPEPAAE